MATLRTNTLIFGGFFARRAKPESRLELRQALTLQLQHYDRGGYA
jgi:hypothetical protein